MLAHIRTILERDLDGLRSEVALYPDDNSLWREVPGCPNTGGNLVLHLSGNLRFFIGTLMGGTGYVRDRDAEFSTRGVSKQELLALIDRTRQEVTSTLSSLDPAGLEGHSKLPGDRIVVTGLWLLHLCAHLAYHLGQIDYHRRTVTGDPVSANVISMQPLVQPGN